MATFLMRFDYVRKAVDEKIDLKALNMRPSARGFAGIFLMAFSYVIGWPLVSLIGIISLYVKEPMVLIIGGPVAYGTSHLVFIIGLYLAGAEYSRVFFSWATWKAVEKLTAS